MCLAGFRDRQLSDVRSYAPGLVTTQRFMELLPLRHVLEIDSFQRRGRGAHRVLAMRPFVPLKLRCYAAFF